MATVPITLTLNATADIPVGNMGFVDLTQADTAWVDITGTGVINIPDWQTDFATTITSTVPNASVNVKVSGSWISLGIIPADALVYNGTDTLLQSISWVLNVDWGTIQAIKIKIF